MSLPRQSGATLIVSLVLLLVVTITGATALRITSLQETTTAGQRHKTLSLMAAEAGASATWAAFNVSNKQNWWVGLPRNGSNAALPIGDNNTAWTMDYINTPSESGGTVFVLGVARNGANGQVLARSKIELKLSAAGGSIPGVLLTGAESGTNDFIVEGNATFNGSAKANNKILIKGTASVTNGTLGHYSGDKVGSNNLAIANLGSTRPTTIANEIGDFFAAEFTEAGKSTYSSGCKDALGNSLPSAGSSTAPRNLKGITYYCGTSRSLSHYTNGTVVSTSDVTITGNLTGMKIISGGTVTHTGGNIGSSSLPTDIVAANDLKLSRDANYTTYGALWAGNALLQEKEKSLTINGCSFSKNSTSLKGSLTFNFVSNCGSGLAGPGDPKIVAWREVTD